MSERIPIQFFQAGATAIPTLLIALAVTIKHGESSAELFAESATRRARWYNLIFALAFILVATSGELCALIALANGNGSKTQAIVVFYAIFFSLILITLEYIQPLAEHLRKTEGIVVGVVLLLGLAAGIAAISTTV